LALFENMSGVQYPSPGANAGGLSFGQMPGYYGSEGMLRAGANNANNFRPQQVFSSIQDLPHSNPYQSPHTPVKKVPQLMVSTPRRLDGQISISQATATPVENSGISNIAQLEKEAEFSSDEKYPSQTISSPAKLGSQQSAGYASNSPRPLNLAARIRPMMEIRDSMLFEVR
jgi:hypothetical protein